MIFHGVFSIHYSPGSEAAMGWAEVGGHNMIYIYDNKRAALHFRGFFFIKLEFSHNINFAERNSEAAMGRVGCGGHNIF